VDLPAEDPLRGALAALGAASQAVNDGTLRLYADDGYTLLHEVMNTLDGAGRRAPVRMVAPSLEDAFSIMVREETGEATHDR